MNTLFVNQTHQVYAIVSPSYVVVASAVTGRVVARIDVGHPVTELAYDNTTNEVLVAGPSTSALFVIDASTDQLVRTIPIPRPAAAMSFDGTNGRLLVMIKQITDIGNGTYTVGGTFLVMDGAQSSYPTLATLTNAAWFGWFDFGFIGSMTVDTDRQVVYVTGAIGYSGYSGIQWFLIGSPNVSGDVYYVGGGPSAFDPVSDTVYVVGGQASWPGYAPGEIAAVSGTTHSLTSIITPNSTAGVVSMTLDSTTERLYELDTTGSLYAIDTQNNTVVAHYSLPPNCGTGISVDPQTAGVYVADQCGDELLDLSTISGRATRVTVGGGGPAGIAYDAQKGDLVVANSLANNVTIVSAESRRVVATVDGVAEASATVYDPKTSDVYVVGMDGRVAILDDRNWTVADELSLPVANVSEGEGSVVAAYDPATSQVYISLTNSFGLSVLYIISDTTHAVVKTIAMGSSDTRTIEVDALAFDPVDGAMWLGARGGYLGWVNWPNLTLTQSPAMNVSNSVYSLVFDGDTETMYAGVASFFNYSVYGAIVGVNASTGRPDSVTTVGQFPFALAWSVRTREIVSANSAGSDLSIVNDSTNLLVGTPTVGQGPTALAYDNATGVMYVADWWANAVSVLSAGAHAPSPSLILPWWVYASVGIPAAAAAIGLFFLGFRFPPRSKGTWHGEV